MADLYDRLAADIVNGAQESWVSALTRLAAESLAKACAKMKVRFWLKVRKSRNCEKSVCQIVEIMVK